MTEMEKELRGVILEEMHKVQDRRNSTCCFSQRYEDLGCIVEWWRLRKNRLDSEGTKACKPVTNEVVEMQGLDEIQQMVRARESVPVTGG